MSRRDRRRTAGRDRVSPSSGEEKTCADCNKYSKRTFYCAKNQKVLDHSREACSFFAPRRAPHARRARKF